MPSLCQGAFANLSANSVISSSQVRLSQKAQAASRRSWASSASSQLQVQGVAGSLAFIFGIELAKLFDINPILVAVSLFLESNQAQESRPCQAGNRLTQSCLSWLSRGNSRGGLRSFHLRGGRSGSTLLHDIQNVSRPSRLCSFLRRHFFARVRRSVQSGCRATDRPFRQHWQ